MSTKGPSNRYGNTKGANHRGEKSADIGYPWAKDFCRGGLQSHFQRHGKELGIANVRDYASKAVHFANEVNRDDYESYIDYKGTTYKTDPGRDVLVEVTKDGYVVSYRRIGGKFWYYSKKGVKTWITTKSK